MACTWPLGAVCVALAPVALAIVFWYSIAKRVTSYTQAFLGLAMAVAPVGGWLAAGGPAGELTPWTLGLAIGAWVAGFDVLYACQDLEVDRREGLRSIPVRFGIERSIAISRALHVVAVAALAAVGILASLGALYFAGVAVVAALLVFEQSLVERERSLTGQARLRPERLGRDPVPRVHHPRGVLEMTPGVFFTCFVSRQGGACVDLRNT